MKQIIIIPEIVLKDVPIEITIDDDLELAWLWNSDSFDKFDDAIEAIVKGFKSHNNSACTGLPHDECHYLNGNNLCKLSSKKCTNIHAKHEPPHN